jgi:FAD/FMN-containing dehydrogenase
MPGGDCEDRLSFDALELQGFERRVVVIAPGAERPVVDAEWRDRLIVVEAGEVELECRGGARARFVRGDVLFIDGLAVCLIGNPGRVPAILATVARHIRPGSFVSEPGTGSRSNTMSSLEVHPMSASTSEISVHDLRAVMTGPVIGPDDAGYDEARAVFPGGIDHRPAAIARVGDAADVARVVTFARERGAELAVRSGGHSGVGHGVSDGGITIDLRGMRALRIGDERSAWAETGLTALEYSNAAAQQGLATGFGDTGSVGIGGITLGGGVGFLARRYGLTVDDLLAAEIVTADGEVLEVDAETHPDLFWAIRGGGGNFGVATRFRLRLHELPTIVGGMLLLPATTETILTFLAESEAAPEELSTIANVMPVPPMPFLPEELHGRLSILALMCFAGGAESGEKALAPFRAIATPLADMLRPMPYPEIYPPEQEDYHPIAASRTMFVDAVDDASAGAILEHLEASDSPMRAVQLRVLGGAMARVPNDATAFAHRDRRMMVNVAVFAADPSELPTRFEWVRSVATSIQRGPEAAYVGFLLDEGPERVRQAYPGGAFDRLARVKAEYDPTNLFRLNQNIPPRAADGAGG